jgi:hypothetical protein
MNSPWITERLALRAVDYPISQRALSLPRARNASVTGAAVSMIILSLVLAALLLRWPATKTAHTRLL